jgi:serine/threonine protein kinase
MSLVAGTRLGAYEIIALIGGGRMGVVYKAVDTRLNRTVALKLVAPEFTRDADANLRFRHEAQAASALDHPNICNIHEIDEAPDGQTFLAMSFYEGETVKQRIERGPLPVREAIAIAAQVAHGLAKAHAAGIIHRDVKPANLIITTEGTVKILDFGIAKTPGESELTQTGMMVGTVAYMAPEQLRGSLVDHRADLWALGVALYEMLVGRAPFGSDRDLTQLSAILTEEPAPISRFREGVPAGVERVVLRALKKRPEERYLTASEFLTDLSACEIAARDGSQVPQSSLVRKRTWAALAATALVLAVTAGIWMWTSSIDARRARETLIPEITRLANREEYAAAYVLAEQAERSIPTDPVLLELWSAISAKPTLQTTPSDADVFFREFPTSGGRWSFVGRTPVRGIRLPQGLFEWKIEKDGFEPLIFAAANPSELLKNFGIPGHITTTFDLALVARGRVPSDMVVVPSGRAATDLNGFGIMATTALERFFIDRHEVRNREFKEFVDAGGYTTQSHWDGLQFIKDARELSIRSTGGPITEVTRLDPEAGDTAHNWPWFLPDGRHFLYVAVGTKANPSESRAIYVGSLNPGEGSKLVLEGGSNGKYADGHVIFIRNRTLMAQPFDVNALSLRGEAIPLAEGIPVGGATGANGPFTVSQTGALAYRTEASAGQGLAVSSKLIWFDRAGKQISEVGLKAAYGDLELSPDGKRLAVSIQEPGRPTGRDIWLLDVARGVSERLTTDVAYDLGAIWSPDSSRVVFDSNRKEYADFDLYQKSTRGLGIDEPLLERPFAQHPHSWSRDGRYLLYQSDNTATGTDGDLWVLPLFGDRKEFRLTQTPFLETAARFSPDAKWIAYTSNETGQSTDVYVTSFPNADRKVRVSSGGGTSPRWREDGKEIFYIDPGNTLMAAQVDTRGSELEIRNVRRLFQMRAVSNARYPYVMSADGQRFLVNTMPEETAATPITVVVNWAAGLTR